MSLRLIAGEKGGLALQAPKGQATRPTLGRVRESLFMILRDRLAGGRVLDLFAGCGALGLEALSRGAAEAVFVESARPALDALRANIERAGWTDRARVVARDAFGVLKRPAPPGDRPFDLILLDPPYHADLAARSLGQLGSRTDGWIAAGGWIVAQVGRRDALEPVYGALNRLEERSYAETLVAFYQARPLVSCHV
jgi:16S rRNA (guanine966-N2)-methyltransferase